MPADEVLVLERPPHHPRGADRQAVVGEADRAGLAERRHLGQLLAAHAAGDGGDEAGRHRGLAAGRARAGRATCAGSSTTGSVLAIATIPQKPPAAAARVPVSMSSLYS